MWVSVVPGRPTLCKQTILNQGLVHLCSKAVSPFGEGNVVQSPRWLQPWHLQEICFTRNLGSWLLITLWKSSSSKQSPRKTFNKLSKMSQWVWFCHECMLSWQGPCSSLQGMLSSSSWSRLTTWIWLQASLQAALHPPVSQCQHLNTHWHMWPSG